MSGVPSRRFLRDREGLVHRGLHDVDEKPDTYRMRFTKCGKGLTEWKLTYQVPTCLVCLSKE